MILMNMWSVVICCLYLPGVQSSPSPAPPSAMPYQPQPAKVSDSIVLVGLTSLCLQEGVDKLAYYQGQVQELTKLLNVCLCCLSV